MPEGADPDDWEGAAHEQAWSAVRAEWIEPRKEVDEPVYDPGWIEETENTAEMQSAARDRDWPKWSWGESKVLQKPWP